LAHNIGWGIADDNRDAGTRLSGAAGEDRGAGGAGSRRIASTAAAQPAAAEEPGDEAMPIEPRTIARIRKNATPTMTILLNYVDELTDRLDRLSALNLTDEQIMRVAGPATDQIGGCDVWMLGTQDLIRLARALLTAAAQERAGE